MLSKLRDSLHTASIPAIATGSATAAQIEIRDTKTAGGIAAISTTQWQSYEASLAAIPYD